MSFHTYYQAIPGQSSLFLRLRTERALSTLYCHLALLGPGPFHMLNLDAIDRDLAHDILEELESLAAHEPAFGSRAAVDRTMAELQKELSQAIAVHPGLETRSAYIEQVHDNLEKCLVRVWKRRGRPGAESLAKTMLYGDKALALDLFSYSELQLTLVPASTVRVGAQALAAIKPAELAWDDDLWDELDDEYQTWKQLYLNAAARAESVVVLGS